MKGVKNRARHRQGSVLDILLILLIVLSILGILWRRQRLESTNGQRESVLYTFYAQTPSMDAMTFDCIRVGDRLYTASGALFGEITVLERVPSDISLLSGGVYYEGRWDETVVCAARVEIAVQGTPTERGVLVAGHRSAVGGSLPVLYSDRVAFRFTLYKMEALDSQ